jgi:DNA uptake protein ComE-like DNA-binding protein
MRRLYKCLFLLISFLVFCACGADTAGIGGMTSALVADGTPEAVGLLNFLNDESTTFEILDDEVPLDRRAAQNLIDHRDGPDGVFNTSDDDPFDTVEEIDQVAYVGDTALERLVHYACLADWVPQGGDLLGVYDGVSFSVAEAEAVILFVNSASETELDDDLDLDRRAVQSIFEARPIRSVKQLAELYYVGKTALSRLKEHCVVEPEVEIGLISDLDRTVIPPHEDALPAEPYPGVAALYNELEFRNLGHPGDVYYVTARGPDRLEGIPEWLEQNGLPTGPIETGATDSFWAARQEKVSDISAILDANPDQNFILFGDTKHVDPEVFREIIELYPGRIEAALVHLVNNANPDRLVGLHPFDNYARAAAILYGQGILTESVARGVMTAAKYQGLDITSSEIEELITNHRP